MSCKINIFYYNRISVWYTVSIDLKSSWANEMVERVTYKEKAMIKECQENQIPRFNPN